MQAPYSASPLRLGPYELLQKLATGGMAEIYVARRDGPHGFSKRIALKRILPQLAADPEFVAMFIDEARLCAQLTHPNLVQVFDFGEEEGELYMAMELVEGTTGAKVARAAALRGEGVAVEVALHIALSVGRGLAHAHEASDDEGRPLGLVHRDVSPGNILISRSGAVKLADFGIARAAEFERRTDQGQLKGKLGYMSPEQVTGRELDPKSDQFTAAIVLAELLMARPLFAGPREMDVLVKIRDADLSVLERNGGDIPRELMAVLRRALSRRPEERFPTTSDYVDALGEVARRGRLAVGPAPLVDFLLRAGLVKSTGKSGEHSINKVPAASPKEGGARGPGAELSEKSSGSQPLGVRAHGPAQKVLAAEEAREGFVAMRAREEPEAGDVDRSIAVDLLANDPTLVFPLRPGELPRRLFDLAAARATGMLTVQHAGVQKKVFFVDGVPEVTVSSDDKELLGALLVERGLALPMEIEMGLAIAPRHGGRLGDALVRLGVLRPMELVRAVVEQMRRRFIELVGWKWGQATFTPGARCPDEESMPEALGPVELIVQGIAAGYSGDDLTSVLAPVLPSLIVPLPRAPVPIAALRLGREETSVLEAITGRLTLSQILAEAAARELATRPVVLRAVFIGLSSGALVSPAWPIEQQEGAPTLPG